MDYSDDVFHTFHTFGSQWDSHKPPIFIQNILNCVTKTNQAFTGLELHEGK